MGVWRVLAGLAIAGADAGLSVIAWGRRAVLSAVAGVAGVGTGLVAAVSAGGGARGRSCSESRWCSGGWESPCSESARSSSGCLTRLPIGSLR